MYLTKRSPFDHFIRDRDAFGRHPYRGVAPSRIVRRVSVRMISQWELICDTTGSGTHVRGPVGWRRPRASISPRWPTWQTSKVYDYAQFNGVLEIF
jgi:hypothetical protein